MTLAVSVDDFLSDERFLPFKDSPLASSIEQFLQEAEEDTPASVWGGRQERGIKLLTAHRMVKWALSTGTPIPGMNIGAITSISGGQESQSLSWSNASTSDIDADLMATVFGGEYLSIKSRLPVMGFRTGMSYYY